MVKAKNEHEKIGIGFCMWRQQILSITEQAGRLFNNQKVFERIESNNPEYERPIFYLPLSEYCEIRFLRLFEQYGAARIPDLISESFTRIRDNITITNETRALALIIGTRETGMPFLGRNPRANRSFRGPLGVYISNFHGSGLDKIYMPSIQRRMSRYLNHGSMRRLIIDDPRSANSHDVGVSHSQIRTIFNVYLRQQNDTFFADLNLNSMDRVARLFWRALTFGGQGGSPWEGSRAGGRNSLKTLMVDLLNIEPSNVRLLWDGKQLEVLVRGITNRSRLRRIARHPTAESRLHARNDNNNIEGWQNLAISEIERGLGTPRYFQAIKAAAITEGVLGCTSWPTVN